MVHDGSIPSPGTASSVLVQRQGDGMSELARFTITGGSDPSDAAAYVVRYASPVGSAGGGFEVVEVRCDATEVGCYWNVMAAPAVTYAAQLAGWPVKACEWSEVGHPEYWPGAVHGFVGVGR